MELEEQLQQAKQGFFDAKKDTDSLKIKNREAMDQLRAFYDDAKKEKALRNEENQKVQECKKNRQAAEEKVVNARNALAELRGKITLLPKATAPQNLRRELEQLEWVQQTEAHSPKEEKEISRKISELRKQLGPAEALHETFKQIRPLEDALREANGDARQWREKQKEHARKSDEHHNNQIKNLKKADALSQKIAESIKQIGEKFSALNEERDQLNQLRGTIRKAEKEEEDKIKAEEAALASMQKNKARAIAEQALEKFRTGGTISLGDLQAIQAAGLELA